MFLKPCVRKDKNQRDEMGEQEHRPGSIIVLWVMTVEFLLKIPTVGFLSGIFSPDRDDF